MVVHRALSLYPHDRSLGVVGCHGSAVVFGANYGGHHVDLKQSIRQMVRGPNLSRSTRFLLPIRVDK